MEILRPLLAETGVEPIGKVVIGTVKGDIHDIGKNLVSMMLEGAGFEVINLGINNARREIPGGARRAQAGHPRHVGTPDDDDALHEGGHRHHEGKGHPQRLTSCWLAARRSTRNSARRSAPMPTAATRRSPWRPRSHCCWHAATPHGRTDPTGSRKPVDATRSGALVIACGALAHEIAALRRLNGWDALDVQCLPPELHNHPNRFPAAYARPSMPRARATRGSLSPTPIAAPAVGSMRCCSRDGIERLPGAHCYEFYATAQRFAEMHEQEPGTFYLTDFLVRHFERLVAKTLGHRSASATDRRVFPQLPPRRVPGAGPGQQRRRTCASDCRAAGTRVQRA